MRTASRHDDKALELTPETPTGTCHMIVARTECPRHPIGGESVTANCVEARRRFEG